MAKRPSSKHFLDTVAVESRMMRRDDEWRKPMTNPWEWYIYLYMNFVDFYGINVGKYTILYMDPMGNFMWEMSSLYC